MAKRSITEIRAADLERKNASRRAAAVVVIPPCADPKRRKRLEKDVYRWLRWYFPNIFTDPFCEHHRAMIQAILDAIKYAGDQAIAAPRGEAKTTIAECVSIYATFTGIVSFLVLFAATGNEARQSLASIKQYIEESDRLAEDYPEVCVAVRHVEGKPQRAHSMMIRLQDDAGDPVAARFQWSGDEISLPRVPGSRCAGAVIATRGLDAAVRGLKRGTRRPQLAVIDDPDTEDTARNPEQAAKLADRIEFAIAGLAPKGKRMSRVMLTTLQNRVCASARFTDPKTKPSWSGRRFAFLLSPPKDTKKWETYVHLRKEGQAAGDKHGRQAHRYYLANRKVMDAGAVVCNPKSFDGRKLPDRSRMQVSAIQRYYDWVADNGLPSALAELQNNPAMAGKTSVTVAGDEVARKLNGLQRGAVPVKAQHVTAMIDVHDSVLYWLACAWEPDFTGYVVDYGTWPRQPYSHFALTSASVTLRSVYPGTEKDGAILQGLAHLEAELLGREFRREDGAAMRISRLAIDLGYEADAVKSFCRRSARAALLLPSKGFYVKPGVDWAAFFRSKPGGQTGFHWRLPPPDDGTRYVLHDSDFWKTLWAERIRSAVGDRGSWSIFGREPAEHALLSEHCTAEVPEWRQQGDAGKWHWDLPRNRPDNHWWDCWIGCAVAASLAGVSVPGIVMAATRKGSWFGTQKRRGR